MSVASSRRDRDADPIYADLILWNAQAAFAAKRLAEGQARVFWAPAAADVGGRDGEQASHWKCTG